MQISAMLGVKMMWILHMVFGNSLELYKGHSMVSINKVL